MERHPRPVSAPPTPIPRPSTSPSLTASAKIPSEGGIRSREFGHRSFRSKSLRGRGGAGRWDREAEFHPHLEKSEGSGRAQAAASAGQNLSGSTHLVGSSQGSNGSTRGKGARRASVCECVCVCVCVRTRVCLFKIRGVIPQRWSRRWGIASVDRGFVS